MFNLIGSRTDHEYGYGGWTGNRTEKEEIVATFDSEKDAKKYIKKALLKSASRWSERPFRQKSLLTNFENAHVEEAEEESPPPHNPTL